ELLQAMIDVSAKGFHYNKLLNTDIIESLVNAVNEQNSEPDLTDRELQLLRLSCTDKSYKEIADLMFLSPRTIESFKERLYEKLNVKTRQGLVLYAIKHKLIDVNT
ncbi:MAG: response regulator transcription factor, partial [Pedobacter sp.]